ncbi:cyclic nucleotide-binding domain-containing protein [uncultured Chitinophaga sp.]|uniref:Crp/Fnr family transcriptional regulator n=1 Tax=uncultured Chitinophaga sp. TaxID=339340 RepID=UPI0025DA0AF3|nr:cyclic nucleotide-binding domain-containing protein [uncultured Chitinophaga sp.]
MTTKFPEYALACRFLQERHIFFTESEFALIRSVTRHVTIPKHTIIMEQGKPVERLYFVNTGIVRLYRVHNEVDYTLGLVSGNEFVSTTLYLSNGMPSSCALETLTEVDALQWGREEVAVLRKGLHDANKVDMNLIERVMMWGQDNLIDLICLTAEERYRKLIAHQPDIIKYVPLKYIASYLNIHQDSLSRIRKLTAQKS